MNHNFFSAFSRVSENDVGHSQPYQFAFSTVQPVNIFTGSPDSNNQVNQIPAHTHHQSGLMQLSSPSIGQVTQTSWVMPGQRQPLDTHARLSQGGVVQVAAGTPLLEWNGVAWIPPQQGAGPVTGTMTPITAVTGFNTSNSLQTAYVTLQQPGIWTSQTQVTQEQLAHSDQLQMAQQFQTNTKQVRRGVENREAAGFVSADGMDTTEQQQMSGVSGAREEVARESLLSLSGQTIQSSHSTPDILSQLSAEVAKRPKQAFDGRFAVCTHCGTMSTDYELCDYCKKKLPENVKLYDPEASKAEEEKRKKLKRSEAERALLVKLKRDQQGDGSNMDIAGRDTQTDADVDGHTTLSFYGRRVMVRSYKDDDPPWTPSGASRGGGRGRGRGRPPRVTETVVLSSDDDGDSAEYSSSLSLPRKVPAAVGRPRKSHPALRPDLSHVPELYLRCTKISMGSLLGKPVEPLHISIVGVDINIETTNESVKVRLDNRDVKECLGCTHRRLPILFIKANTSFGVKVRNALKMTTTDVEPYYNPDSTNAKFKYIVAHIDASILITDLNLRLNEVFRAISLQYQTGGVLFRCLDLIQAKTVLDETLCEAMTPSSGENEAESSSRSAAADQELLEEAESSQDGSLHSSLLFTGPVRKLFTYPFPPNVGGITVTNEDYFCLTEGEFLNDVIVSFYLKYLSDEVLSPADRDRSIFFSSFFYTRLTQTMTQAANKDQKTLAEKRHHRVKTWTKHVDIFEKDFIIIPINEHSHWYLAIICYPSLNHPVYVSSKKTSDDLVSSTTPEVSTSDSTTCQSYVNVGSSANADSITNHDTLMTRNINDSDAGCTYRGMDSLAGAQDERKPASELEEPASAVTSAFDEPAPKTSASEYNTCFGFDESEDEEPLSRTSGEPSALPAIEKRPCILIFDSLAGATHASVVRALRDYLTIEWRTRKGTEKSFEKEVMCGANPKCPQQDNYSDCGIYMLQYAQSFFENSIKDYTMPLKCTKDWFLPLVIKRKRADIQQLIKRIESDFIRLPPRQRTKTS